jgi:hypothetical protein
MNEKIKHRSGSRALVVGSAVFLAGVMPAACSGGSPEVEGGKVSGTSCTSAAECPLGQVCNANGRCTGLGTGSGGASATGGTTGNGGSIIVMPTGGSAGTDGGGPPPDAACGADIQQAMLVPVNMFVMFDRSGSMNDEADETTGASRWDLASAALTMFFQDATAAGLGVALRFFPHDSPAVGCMGGDNGACDAQACSQPLVPLMASTTTPLPQLSAEAAPADAHEAALVSAIMSSAPAPSGMMGGGMMSGGTPIYAALDGATRWTTAYQMAHPYPAQQTVVVFVTDGEPNGCEDDFDLISELAAQAYASAGVTTYTIGLTGSNEADMEQVAEAGNGDSFFVDDGPTAAQDLVAALQAIQGAALDCDFAIPTPTTGGTADPRQVNVQYTTMMGATPISFTQVPTAADCGMSQSWYYDDPAAPSRIHLCPDVCDTVRANPTAGIAIAIGCATIIEPPR